MGDDVLESGEPDVNSPEIDVAEWVAPEFIAHEKSTGWYLALGVGGIVLAALIYLVFKDLVSSFVVIVVAVIFGVYGSHRPKDMTYRLDREGLDVGKKHHSYEEFKSFSAKPEGDLVNITMTPLKRFSPYLNIYYSEKDEKAIMAVLTPRLPYEEPKSDVVDILIRKMRL